MTRVSSLAQAVKEISATFSGQLLQSGDSGYEEGRRVHNGLIDKAFSRCPSPMSGLTMEYFHGAAVRAPRPGRPTRG